ncbi:MAG TPA: drug:proton antiporter [Acidimicrobiaceae bacterium]|nr:drug:proton antiporter [Acidimicrobiaceae bacterium]
MTQIAALGSPNIVTLMLRARDVVVEGTAAEVAQVERRESDMGSLHRIVFTPSGLETAAPEGSTVLSVAQASQIDLDSVCGARGVCGRCQFRPSFGEFPKWALSSEAENLSEIGVTELEYQNRRAMIEGARLGCQATILGPLVIDVPPESQVHAPVIRKDIDLGGLSLDPVSVVRVIAANGSLSSMSGLKQAIGKALKDEWGLVADVYSSRATKHLQSLSGGALANEQTLTIQIRQSDSLNTISSVVSGTHVEQLGVAIDLGSTTVAAHLLDLRHGEVLATSGAMNPQIRLGEDLMSRVSYVMMNADGGDQLTRLARDCISKLVAELVGESGHTLEDVTEVVVVGNPVMHHSFLGFDVVPLGQMPFELATNSAILVDAEEVELPLPNASVYLPPCIAGHVGADTSAAILAQAPYEATAQQLLVDIGTNAEVVFGDNEQLYAASSPTGPAFEGAQITHGQRAVPGAIERVRIDRDSLEPEIKVIGCDYWSSHPAFEDAVSDIGVTGICGSGVIEAVAELFLSGLMTAEGVILDSRELTQRVVADGRTFSYVLYPGEADFDSTALPITVTQPDVRAIQLAKAALRAGIDLLVERADQGGPKEIRLAGAFGAQIDPKYAMVLGLIPDCDLGKVVAVGNAAGSGAVRLLLSKSERNVLEGVVPTVEKVETAIEARFQELFVDAMSFPHASARNPNLEKTLKLPSFPLASTTPRSRRRRRPARKES